MTWPHEHGHLGHAEILIQFRQTPESIKAIQGFSEAAVKMAIDNRYGVPHSLSGMVAGMHDMFGPFASNYNVWQRRLKQAFDPNEVSDPLGYIVGKE